MIFRNISIKFLDDCFNSPFKYIRRLANDIIINKSKEIKKLKIILLGEKGVGKSSLIKRYVSNKFHSFEDKQDLEINIKKIDIDDNTSAELSIYDTTNEQKLGKNYIQQSQPEKEKNITKEFKTKTFYALFITKIEKYFFINR